jgi:hypothetical protein
LLSPECIDISASVIPANNGIDFSVRSPGNFFGDPKWFYNRFVAISYVAEENSGKVWTKDEDTILEEMINDNFHIGDIASELKRDIMSIALRGAKYVDIESNIIMKIDRQSLYYTRFTEF